MSESTKKTGRNTYDVIMELIELHFYHTINAGDQITEEEIERVYLKYYKLIKVNR